MAPEIPHSRAPADPLGQALGLERAYAHGFPRDLWMMNADGSAVHQVAQLAADDGTVSWSPDGSQLFVYGGTGSFLVDAMTGDVTDLPFIAGLWQHCLALLTSLWPTSEVVPVASGYAVGGET
jgi:hypothetical protein